METRLYKSVKEALNVTIVNKVPNDIEDPRQSPLPSGHIDWGQSGEVKELNLCDVDYQPMFTFETLLFAYNGETVKVWGVVNI